VVDAGRQISRQDCHSAGFPAAASNDGPELLYGLQRLAVAAREGFEDDTLVFGQLLADDRDQKDASSLPAMAGKQRSEISGALQSLAHGDDLPDPHVAALRWTGREKCSASVDASRFAGALLRPRRFNVRPKALATRVICSSLIASPRSMAPCKLSL
jgi:hypothetical protein